ncbi:S8 family serine peptidase [Mycetocola reblochoni]|uniref:Serine protease n=2 Tax=Mycetocola reblochoni TaxID=331618 RepID=A0A1R4I8F8_9MICO|nr:S8 family serine peptidase [Mycetocola reblochoni]RLP68944.1 type VII secretion-associated serine protease mycosin [Mycetocola reblochoni]SJN16117.1 Serine protease [Mycetocola reblochoni REB411]
MSAHRPAVVLLAVLTAGVGLVAPTAAVRAEGAEGACASDRDAAVITEASWGQRLMSPDGAWARTRGDVVVAVVDTGVDGATRSLAGAVLPGTDLDGGRGDGDCFGRGTFVASLIAGDPVEGTEFLGTAPDATILPVRITDDPDDHEVRERLPEVLAEGIRLAVDGGASVIAVPAVADRTSAALGDAVAAATEADVLVIAAAAAPEADALAYPAGLDGVLAVAPLGEDGPSAANGLGAVPDLAAPAEGLVGAAPGGDGHVSAGGAELAVGYAAGAAALVRAEYPELSAEQVTARLTGTADRSGAVEASGLDRDSATGFGVVDPVAAATRLEDDAPAAVAPEAGALVVPAEPDRRPALVALAVAGGSLALAAGVLLPAVGVVLLRRAGRGGARAPRGVREDDADGGRRYR